MRMKIEARITSIVGGEKLKAYASVLIENSFLVKGIKVIDGSNGRFAAMPSRRTRKGEYADICFPITKELRKEIERKVLEAYAKKVEEM